MSRPKPIVLLEHTNNTTHRTEQIIEAENSFIVFYNGKPFNLKSSNSITNEGPKYKKTSFANPGHAYNLAKRLNNLFNTDAFTVYKL